MHRFKLIGLYGVFMLGFVCFGSTSNAQETQEQADFLEFKDHQGYYISEMGGEKDISNFPDALEVSNSQNVFLTEGLLEEGISISDFGFTILSNKYTYLRIGDTGKLLVIYPEDLIIQLYNKQ